MWSSGVQHVLFVTITGDIFFFLTTYTKTVSMIFFFLLQMYTLLSGYWKYFFQKEEYNVLILGLDNAGKTVSVPTGRKWWFINSKLHENLKLVIKIKLITDKFLFTYSTVNCIFIDLLSSKFSLSNVLQGLSWSWSYGSWIYDYLCNQCLSSLKLWVQTRSWQGVLDITLCDEVYQWLAAGLWFSGFPPLIKLTAMI